MEREEPNSETKMAEPGYADEAKRGCSEHSNKMLTVFCYDHQSVCCLICAQENHKDCSSLDLLKNIGKNLNETKTVEQMMSCFVEISEKMENISEQNKQNMETLLTKQTVVINNVRKDISKMIAKLEAMLVCFEEELNEKVTNQIRRMEKQQKEIKELQQKSEILHKELSHVYASGAEREIALQIADVRDEMAKYQANANNVFSNDSIKMVDLDFDDQVLKVIYKSLPLLKVNLNEMQCPVNLNQIFESLKTLSDGSFQEQRLDISATTDIADIEAVKRQDSVCILTEDEIVGTWITGGASLVNGDTVVCDFNNQKLKYLDKADKIKFVCSLKSCPWDISVIGVDGLLVCFTNEIERYRISSDFLKIGTIPISGVQGIQVLGNHIFAISSHKVQILSDDGDVMKSFNRGSGNYIPAVAVSKHFNRFYYMDGPTKLVCRNSVGKLLWEYDNVSLSSSAGMGVDLCGHVYVCCVEDGKIHTISRDGTCSRSMINIFDVIKKPWKLWFDHAGDTLFVSEYGESSVVEVYQLKMKQKRLELVFSENL